MIESTLHEKCREIPYAENILEIKGVGENILAEMGDISRFDDVKQIQNSVEWLMECRSVTIKHKNKSCSRHRFFPWGMTPFRSLAGTQCMVDGTKEVGT